MRLKFESVNSRQIDPTAQALALLSTSTKLIEERRVRQQRTLVDTDAIRHKLVMQRCVFKRVPMKTQRFAPAMIPLYS